MTLCWGFLLIEALVLAEINVFLSSKKEKRETGKEEFEIISIRTMAQETLGDWGGTLATVNYVFLGYTTLVAYTSKSGEIINHLSNIPSNISGVLFALLFSVLVSIGGTRRTDQVNQWLTTTMIGLLIAIEAVAVSSEKWSGFEAVGNWGEVPATIPLIIFTLVYHDLAPVICAYLGGDLRRIRLSFTVGSLLPLLVLLIWDAVALGLSGQADQIVDPVDLLMRVNEGRISTMVEAFSLLAVGTSLIGTLLGFSQFFLEQLNNLPEFSPLNRIQTPERNGKTEDARKWWVINKVNIAATAVAVAPPLFISTTFPDVFSIATDIAGGYCMTVLYGVLPPAMAWAMHNRLADEEDRDDKRTMTTKLSMIKPVLIGLGVFACAIVCEEILQDLSIFHFPSFTS